MKPFGKRFLSLVLLVIALFVINFTNKDVYAAGADDFVTTWKTDNPGTSADNQITIPTIISSYNYDVDWGDGTTDSGVTGSITHTYATPGTYTVRISGLFPRIYFNNAGDKEKILSVDQWGTINWLSFAFAFHGASNMNINAVDAPNLSSVTSFESAFRNNTSLNADLSSWDVSNVSNFTNMFRGASIFNGDITNWNTSNATTLSGTFFGASSFNQPIGGWNVSNVNNMSNTFNNASSFDQPLNSWVIDNVDIFFSIFEGASSFNQDLNNWDTTGIDNFSSVFKNATLFNGDVTNWDLSIAHTTTSMFEGASSFNQPIGGWDVRLVEDMVSMFQGASSFNQPLNSWQTDSVITIFSIFRDASSFNQDLTNWDTSRIVSFASVFQGATNFNGDITNWNTTSARSMVNMFRFASSFNRSLNGWSMDDVTSISNIFDGASSFNQDLDNWGSASFINVVNAFNNATSFNGDISTWNVSGVSSFVTMFQGATSFNSDITNWNTSNASSFTAMFRNASSFNQPVGSWNMQNSQVIFGMFDGATSFDQDISDWDVSNVNNAGTFLSNSGFSTKNYDVLLIQWSQLSLQDSVVFQASSAYCHGEDGRNEMIDTYDWNIVDGGLDCTFANKFATSILVDGQEFGYVEENLAPGALVGLLTAVDADAEDSHTFAKGCVVEGPDDDKFAIDGAFRLWSMYQFDFETFEDANKDGIYEICLLVTDDGKPNLTTELNARVQIIDVNAAPTDIFINGDIYAQVLERRNAGSSIAKFTTIDDGENNVTGDTDQFIYTLNCTVAQPDDVLFSSKGDELVGVSKLYFSNPQDADEDNVYDICVRSTERFGGLFFEKNLQIEVLGIGTQQGSASVSEPKSSLTDATVNFTEITDPEVEPYVQINPFTVTQEEGNGVVDSLISDDKSKELVKFDPTTIYVTRGEFLKYMVDEYLNITGEDLPSIGSESFPDVDPANDLYWYVVYTADKGVLLGDDGQAALDRGIYRVEALAMVLRLLGIDYDSYEYNGDYSDVSLNDWFVGVIEASIEAGLIMWGVDDNMFYPEETLIDVEVKRLLKEVLSRV